MGHGVSEEHIERYVDLGWSLLPLLPGSKDPHWDILRTELGQPRWARFQRQRATMDQLRRWLLRDPDLNLGVVLGDVSGGLVCVDVDVLEGVPPAIDALLPPTATVKTARGMHRYFRCLGLASSDYSWGELRAEGNYAVLPPSIHHSGHVYEWTTAPDMIADLPEGFVDAIKPVRAAAPEGPRAPVAGARVEALAASLAAAEWAGDRAVDLPEGDLTYLTTYSDEDRSKREMGIINRLVNKGWSDHEVSAFLGQYPRTRHAEEVRSGRGHQWLARSLIGSRDRLHPHTPIVSITKDCTRPVPNRKAEDDPRWSSLGQQRRWLALKLVQGQAAGDLVVAIKSQLHVQDRQAKEYMKWLREYRGGDLVEVARIGRHQLYSLSAKGKDLIERVEHHPSRFLQGNPPLPFWDYHRTPPKAQDDADDPDEDPNEVGDLDGADDLDTDDSAQVDVAAAAKARRAARTEAWKDTQKARRREGLRRKREEILGRPMMHFVGNRRYVLQFLDEDIFNVLLHKQLRVGWTRPDNAPLYSSFVSQRDEALEGPDADDPFLAHDPPAHAPRMQGLAAAVVLDDVDGTLVPVDVVDDLAVPRLVVQSPTNFWTPLYESTSDRPASTAVEIRRTGQGRTTRFTFTPRAQRWHGELRRLDLDQLLDELADPDRARQSLAAVPPGTALYGD